MREIWDGSQTLRKAILLTSYGHLRICNIVLLIILSSWYFVSFSLIPTFLWSSPTRNIILLFTAPLDVLFPGYPSSHPLSKITDISQVHWTLKPSNHEPVVTNVLSLKTKLKVYNRVCYCFSEKSSCCRCFMANWKRNSSN